MSSPTDNNCWKNSDMIATRYRRKFHATARLSRKTEQEAELRQPTHPLIPALVTMLL